MRLRIECLGHCKKKYSLVSPGKKLPMPNVWKTGMDGRPSECRSCGGPIRICDIENCVEVFDTIECLGINHARLA
jgi:hypothetical protein